ncbi:MAG: bifunctional phosphopantothenoylcysteine decarboxylase/phosphopantothenate--cysteine ligase CoaBC [Thermoplasmatales archaeon]
MQEKLQDVREKTAFLKGKRVILGVTGSISAVETVKLIHELRRHGADVSTVMTDSAKSIIGPFALQYASGNSVVEKLTGAIEHVSLVDQSDILLVAPATANTIAKMAHGIDDTPVTSVFSNSLGSIPVLVAPAMHQNMYKNPIISKNIDTLKSYGVSFIDPVMEEGKAKIADTETIVAEVIRKVHRKLAGIKVCVVGGSSYEPIDDMRVITNNSSGETSIALATVLYYMGAELSLFFGITKTRIPPFLKYKRFSSVESLVSMVDEISSNDIVFVPAALSDFTVEKTSGKIPSDSHLNLELKPAPKFLKILRGKFNGRIIGFKAEYNVSKEELKLRAKRRMIEYGLDFVVANDLKDVREGSTKVIVIGKEGETEIEGDKLEVARRIVELVS